MAARFAAIVPRMAGIGLVWLFATGTMTYAAGEKLTTPATAPAPVATPRPTLIVPDVSGQAFVFAKGILEDGGFGWRVTGSVQGYATNVVVSQEPAAGRIRRQGRPQGAAERNSADCTGEEPGDLAGARPQGDHRERPPLALPARVDRHRRQVRLVARGTGSADAHSRRQPRRGPLGHGFT